MLKTPWFYSPAPFAGLIAREDLVSKVHPQLRFTSYTLAIANENEKRSIATIKLQLGDIFLILNSERQLVLAVAYAISSLEMNGGRDEEEKGLLWKLPSLKSKQLGSLGPAFGAGAGCGVGFSIGFIGGAGFGPGIPGLQLGFGFGAGCGIGVGFGYGMGRGIAFDANRRHSNVGRVSQNRGIVPVEDEIGAVVDELVLNTKKLIEATSRAMDKWRRV